ncbi:hypothetical protein HERIO_1011 [Hepatospora eriocheir]|uniref:Uncharacterized protein n=1 Tax=Hepatospora eriocheir TaxID=1081669 RepID=A0A1X0QBB4_9MICR|nr:hypothetical protein HERIO_1011 [Hepatospora eriocheir]
MDLERADSRTESMSEIIFDCLQDEIKQPDTYKRFEYLDNIKSKGYKSETKYRKYIEKICYLFCILGPLGVLAYILIGVFSKIHQSILYFPNQNVTVQNFTIV